MMHPTEFDPPGAARDPDLLTLAAALLQRRRMVVGAMLLGGAIAALLVAFGRGHTATATFMVEQPSTNLSSISGLASQFGFDVPGGLAGEPLGLFEALIHSDDLLLELADTSYPVPDDGPSGSRRGTVADLLGISGATETRRRVALVEHLRAHVQARVLYAAGAVEISATTPWPALSEAMVARALELLDEFNLHRRQSSSAAERRFVEASAARARRDLLAAEDRLQAFLDENRHYEGSPQLAFQHARLQREVALHQQLVTSLLQAHQQARIAEVRNTPIISVVDHPQGSAQPSASVTLAGVAGAGLGLMIGVFLAAVSGYLERQRQAGNPAYFRTRDHLLAATGRRPEASRNSHHQTQGSDREPVTADR